jgi:hypothetical protein
MHGYGNGPVAAGSMHSFPAADLHAHEHQQPPPPPTVQALSHWNQQQQQPQQADVGALFAVHGSAGVGYSNGGFSQGPGGAPWAAAAPGGPTAEEELTEVAL